MTHSQNGFHQQHLAQAYTDALDFPLVTAQAAEMSSSGVVDFVSRYLAEEAATVLLARLGANGEGAEAPPSPYAELARNPLLLAGLMVAYASAPDAPLPSNKGALLHRLALEVWEQECTRQPDVQLTFEALQVALGALAFAMVDQDSASVVAREYALEKIGAHEVLEFAISAKLLEEQGETIRFYHPLMQDYFTAVGLQHAGLPTRLTQPTFDDAGKRLPMKWDAVIIALCGIAANPDITVSTVAEVDPYLALECVASGIEVSQATHQQLINYLVMADEEQGEHDDPTPAPAPAAERAQSGETTDLSELIAALRECNAWHTRQTAHAALRQLDPPTLPGLTQALHEVDHDMRGPTATALRQLGDAALPTLLYLLHDQNWVLRRSAAWGLGELRDSAGVPGLVELLNDSDSQVSAEAATALGWIRDRDAVPALIAALRHDHWRLRKAAAWALGWIGTPALDGLLATLKAGHEDVQRAAIEALAMLHDAAVLPALIEASHDPNVEIRSAAIDALRNTEDVRAVNRLIESLSDNVRARWNKLRVSELAAGILEKIGTPQAAAALSHWREHGSAPDAPAAEAATRKGFTLPVGKKSASKVKERLQNEKESTNSTAQTAPLDPFKALQHKDWAVRRNAVLALGNVDISTALPKLMNALRDDDNQVRLAAVKMLATMKNDYAVEGLLQALGDDDSLICDAAADALTGLGRQTVPGLLKVLDNPNANMCGAAIEVLGKLGDAAAVDGLKVRLTDTRQPWLADQRICDLAARALLLIGTPEARAAVKEWQESPLGSPTAHPVRRVKTPIPNKAEWNEERESDEKPRRDMLTELLDTLRTDQWGVRQEAAKALREYAKTMHGSKNAADTQRLSEATQDKDWVVRWAASEALAWIGDTSVVPVLIERLADDYWMVRIAAVRALVELGDRRAVAPILKLLGDENNNVRETAAEALGGLSDPAAVAGLAAALSDHERFVRLAAVEALGKIRDRGSVQVLLKALNDEDNHVRWAAAEALGRIGDASAVPELIAHLEDIQGPHWEEKRVCDIVAEALEAIGTPEASEAVENWRRSHLQKQP